MLPIKVEEEIIHIMKEINPELNEVYIEDVVGWIKYFLSDKQLMWKVFKHRWERDNK